MTWDWCEWEEKVTACLHELVELRCPAGPCTRLIDARDNQERINRTVSGQWTVPTVSIAASSLDNELTLIVVRLANDTDHMFS